jgi:hypothetical protein
MIEIKNIDLYSNKYTEDILIYNINKLAPYSILITQNNLSNEFIINYNPHDMATDPLDLSMAVLPKRPCPRSFDPDTYPLGSLSYELPEISQEVLDKIGAVDVIEKSIYKGIFIYKKWLKLEIIFIY